MGSTPKKINLNRHSTNCAICNHPDKADIEMDYLHCIPWSTIVERYGKISNSQIQRHAIAFELPKKRDRKNFYWQLIENTPLSKMTVENALEAAKQLDRIERVIVDNPTPSNIQVVYSFGRLSAGPGNTDGKDRVRAAADTAQVSSVREEVPPL